MTARSWRSVEGGSGDVDALGVGAGIGRGEEESGVVEEVVEEGDVGGGEAFEEVAAAEGHAEPEAFGAGAGEEGAAGEAFGVDGVGEVEVADVADVLDVVEKKGDDSAFEVEKIDGAVLDEGGERQVAGEGFAGEAADDDLFVGGGHGRGIWLWRIVAWRGEAQRKRCRKGSHFATVVLE